MIGVLGPLTGKDVFPICNIVFVPWALLIFLPQWNLTNTILNVVGVITCALYTITLFTAIAKSEGDAPDFFSFDGVYAGLSDINVIFPAWIHYCAMDLWTGRWISEDMASRGITLPIYVRVPLLFMTMMLCPVGLFLYLALVRPMFSPKAKSD